MDRNVRVVITLKKSVLDPQGEAVLRALDTLGFKNIKSARIGKVVDLVIEDSLSVNQTKSNVNKMSEKLLANPIMENFEIEIKNAEGVAV